MSKHKKKFKAGLESLFGVETEKDTLPEESPLLIETETLVKKKKGKKIKRGKRSGKNFTSDLDSLFTDTVKETIKEQAQSLVKDEEKTSTKRRRKRPLSGLDALIQRTYEGPVEDENFKKRVTFILEKKKVEKLKKIAKSERKYLKDLLNKVLTKFMDEYEKDPSAN